MRRIYSLCLLLSFSLVFIKCQKELSSVGSSDPDPVLPDPISAKLQGTVVDENGQAAAGVTITVGPSTATTDAKGYFRINNATLDKNAALVTAEKSGYFKAYRTFPATAATNQVMIKLIKKALAGTVTASTGGEVSLSTGAKVNFPANAIVTASSGAAYSGTVNVYASYIDPSAADISQTVPGSFMANDKNGARVTLTSYGMMAVVLESATGEKLQIKSGSSANLTTPIPSSLQSSAPATIALWSVDEQTGVWKEEGTATKNGTNYVGAVSHFSFWNCDVSASAVMMTVTLKNSDNAPIVHANVRVKRTGSSPGQAYGWTDSTGTVKGLVPANEGLVLEVLDPCNNVVYSQNIGPFAQATNLGTISVTIPGSSYITVKGTLKNCSGGNVTNGYAVVRVGDRVQHTALNASGEFTAHFISCSSLSGNVEVLGVDLGTLQQGSVITGSVISGLAQVGNISACGTSAAQFINYTLDGTNYSIGTGTDSLMAYTGPTNTGSAITTMISGYGNNSQTNQLNLRFEHLTNTAGTYNITSLYVGSFMQSTVTSPSTIVITNFPTMIGQFYEGTFSATFTATGAVHTLSGSFKIRKTF